MFDGLKRKFAFGKIADALDSLRRRLLGEPSSGDGKMLGWDMGTWKLWLEGLAVSAIGGALGTVIQKLAEFQACLGQVPPVSCPLDLRGIGVAAAGGALAALVAWFRMNPGDPRRTPWDGVDRRVDPQAPKQ